MYSLTRQRMAITYISIVMGAQEKPLLYEDMTAMIDLIPAQQQE